jgi:hypothetical protein
MPGSCRPTLLPASTGSIPQIVVLVRPHEKILVRSLGVSCNDRPARRRGGMPVKVKVPPPVYYDWSGVYLEFNILDQSSRTVLRDTVAKEDKAGWSEFLKHRKERGLSSVRLIISDACMGLAESAAEFFPDAAWQRCIVHWYRNIFSHVPSTKVRLAISMDGLGDGFAGRVSLYRDGVLNNLNAVPINHSIGTYYTFATEICGFPKIYHCGKSRVSSGEGPALDYFRHRIVFDKKTAKSSTPVISFSSNSKR